MDTQIIVELIGAAATIIAVIITGREGRKKSDIKQAVRDARLDDRMNAIEHKLDVHNGYAEKFGEIAVDIAELKTEVRNLKDDR